MNDWQLFQGQGKQQEKIEEKLKGLEAPPWREFAKTLAIPPNDVEKWKKLRELSKNNTKNQKRGQTFRISEKFINIKNAVNAAIYLRRPLLVTGKPGSGKTSLVYAIAYELNLGEVLTWPITARTTLQEGLYSYDAIGRLQDIQLGEKKDIGAYITLGPLGTAFIPSALPRVVLIDEIDKSDINLPNDLLNIFEEGKFTIPELIRIAKPPSKVTQQNANDNIPEFIVKTQDTEVDATVRGGEVYCVSFPIIVMTSNGERDFPPAFKRRCLRVNMPDPDSEEIKEIVKAHLGNVHYDEFKEKIDNIIKECSPNLDQSPDLAIDQLLNTVYLLTQKVRPESSEEEEIKNILLKELSVKDE